MTFIIYNVTAKAANSRYNNGSLPTRIVEVANVQSRLPTNKLLLPDWKQISLSQLPGINQSGAINGSPYNQILGYDLSRTWTVGMTPDEYLKMGDISEALQAEQFSLQAIADITSIDLNNVPLSEFPLIEEQTLSHLAKVVPQLAQTPVKDIQPVAALLQTKGIQPVNLRLSQIIKQYQIGQMQLKEIDLSKFSLTSIPNLETVPIQDLTNWMNSFVKNIPGLGQVPLGLMPNPIIEIGNLVMRIDAVYGTAENQRQNTISGSDVQGFSVSCTQKDCAYVELDNLENVGASDRSYEEGKQWISGKYQEVEGGWGLLKAVNNGREPTGRLPFGKAFKVVVMEPDETTDTVDTALYFRFCAWRKGCTPYFIGPIPFFSYEVNALMFVGNLDSANEQSENFTSTPTGATRAARSNPSQSNTVTSQVNPCTFTNKGRSIINQSFNGVNLRLLGNAIAEIESAGSGDYKAVGVYTCADNGLNCGRGLGRYQFMSYNPYAVQLIAAKTGGEQFLSRVKQGYQPTEAELFEFFPPADQDKAFMADIANKIQATQSEIDPTTGQLFTGERLIERVAQKHFGGDNSKVDASSSDAFGRLSLKDYGRTALALYSNNNSDNGTLTCASSFAAK
ncbi:M23 family peptidase [Richelia sinica FACHB-800]|nr:M23 family peptidase [Richelia sinica FACHB-800]